MSWSRTPAILLLVAASMLVSACGFSVRGAGNIPEEISIVYIETPDRFSVFYRALVNEIRASRLTLADDSSTADMIIRVSLDITGQRTLSVSARNIPTEFQVWYTVQYTVFVDREEVLELVQHTRTRDYTYDETVVLGKANEEDNIRKALANELVGLVVQRVSSLN